MNGDYEVMKKVAPDIGHSPVVLHQPRAPIALVTMTKNGRQRLPRLFESVLGFADKAIVLDTGSTDEMLDWLNEQKFLPVEIWQKHFIDFSTSRNQLFEFAKGKADWLLLLDDDMFLNFLIPRDEIKQSLNVNKRAYMLKIVTRLHYWTTRIVRGDLDWKYVGVTHEYLEGGGPNNPRLEGVEIEHWFNHGLEKFERDLRLLSADIARDPEDVRTIFYLANTLRDMGKTASAIRFYCMRANMGGWDEEVYQSMYEAARLANDPAAMAKAFGARPTRAEPAAWLALYYKKEGATEKATYWESVRAQIPMSDDVLFVIPSAYGLTLKPL